MRSALQRTVWLAAIGVAAALPSMGRAQGPAVPPAQRVFVPVPAFTGIRLATTVTVADGGTTSLGGYSRVSEGRTSYGAPVLGGVPYVGRGFRNIGYGRSTVSGGVTASVRIISLREEEYRQTGVRSP
jgi:type II secretory pathway component GspD/PulD (secretin)